MSKVPLIIRREYLTRVRKKSFIIMTIVGPLLMGLLFIIPIMLSQVSDKTSKILVLDHTGIYKNKFQQNNNVEFYYDDLNIDSAKKKLKTEEYFSILVIDQQPGTTIPSIVIYHGDAQPSLPVLMGIQNTIQHELETAAGCDEQLLGKIKNNLNVVTRRTGGEETSSGVATGIGYAAGFLIYFFIFLYGAQVMRGVIEEKTNRIVEVIISSVKPFQLMMGKIIGIALVGLTQFVLWIILTSIIFSATTIFFSQKASTKTTQAITVQAKTPSDELGQNSVSADDLSNLDMRSSIIASISSLPLSTITICFVIYFLGGYLLYSALFAAIGSAVDSEADTQQFMLPVTIPLILSMIVSSSIILKPNGPIAFWFSMFPLTSPVTMMIRLPFGGVPIWQIALSISLLILGFLGTTWFASKVYRTGILMYGKKASWRELFRWLKY